MVKLDITPTVVSAADLSDAIAFADRHPHARWYVSKRADALGARAAVPVEWSLPSAVVAAQGVVQGLLDGIEADGPTCRSILSLARQEGVLEHPAVLAALNWREWLHPRGRDGQFIEKDSRVDVFAPGRGGKLGKRRAQIEQISPDGVRVKYVGPNGEELRADPQAGFPQIIPSDEVKKKVALAPPARARLRHKALERPDDQAQVSEAGRRWHESTEAKQWFEKADAFNDVVDDSDSVNKPGTPLKPGPRFSSYGFTPETSAAEAFLAISDQQDPAFVEHRKFVNETLDDARTAGLNSGTALKDEDDLWLPETKVYMQSVVDELVAAAEARGVKRDKKNLMLGGLPGAGKSSLVEAYGLDPNEWVTANPDDVKDILIRDGLYPNIDGLSPAEEAGLTHELSSDITWMLANELADRGFNTISDITMGGRPDPDTGLTNAEEEAKMFREKGYSSDAVFVDVPVGMSAVSQTARHLEGVNRLRTGKQDRKDVIPGQGGRFVPEFILAGSEGDGENTRNKLNFERMRQQGAFDRWYVTDNTDFDTTPKLLGRGRDRGREPKYRKTTGPDGRVQIVLDEPLTDIPGMFTEAEIL